MQALLDAVREALPPAAWSRGVHLCRDGRVVFLHPDALDADEIEAHVAATTGGAAAQVVLYVGDAEWECNCVLAARQPACPHVAAAAICLGHARAGRVPAAGIAGWLSVMLAAVSMSLMLAASGTSPLEVVLPAMLGVHAFIGVGEALITAAALAFIAATRPDLLNLRPVSRMRTSIKPSSIRVRCDGAKPEGRYVELPRKNSDVCSVLLS